MFRSTMRVLPSAVLPSLPLTMVKLVAPSGPITAYTAWLILRMVDSIGNRNIRMAGSFQDKKIFQLPAVGQRKFQRLKADRSACLTHCDEKNNGSFARLSARRVKAVFGQEMNTTKGRHLKPASRRERPARVKPSSTQPQRDQDDLSRFFANTLGMLCIAGFDGYFKRLNPAWESTLGWTLEELQRKPFIEFVHPDDRASTISEANELARGGRTIFFENRYRCKDGSYKWLQWNANSLRARRQIYALATDITRRKALENEILETSDRKRKGKGKGQPLR